MMFNGNVLYLETIVGEQIWLHFKSLRSKSGVQFEKWLQYQNLGNFLFA